MIAASGRMFLDRQRSKQTLLQRIVKSKLRLDLLADETKVRQVGLDGAS